MYVLATRRAALWIGLVSAVACGGSKDSERPTTMLDAGAGASDAGVDVGAPAGAKDASVDATEPADAAPPPPILSAACRSCAAEMCADGDGPWPIDCNAAPGVASAGPGAGKTNAALCAELIACARNSGCSSTASGDVVPCFCGQADDDACADGKGTGVCRAAVEAVAGTTDARTIAEFFYDPTRALGFTTRLLTCLDQECARDCRP